MTRVAVVGAGIMGTSHARILRTIPGVELVGVVDAATERAEAVAVPLDIAPLSLDEIADRADAAILAVPSHLHAEVGCSLLRSGVDLLVEKPIATTADDARRLITTAAAHDRVLMVGHVERFNSAVLGLTHLVHEPVHLEFTRTGPYSSRISSDVVLDLMIHDLDLARLLTGAKGFSRMHAVGGSVYSGQLDHATCLLVTEDGVTVTLTANRVGQNKIRTIEITQRDNFVSADLLRQDINVHRVEHSEYLTEGGARYRQSGFVEIPFLERIGEPLRVELEAFLTSVSQRTPPPVTGEDGLAALELALQITALIEGR